MAALRMLWCMALLGGAARAEEPGNRVERASELASLHSYGALRVDDSPADVEAFRATFGGLLPCGDYPLSWAHDGHGCNATLGPTRHDGAVLVAERGNCSFVAKAMEAQRAGAHGLVVVNVGEGIIRPSAGAERMPLDVRIPVVMVSAAAGETLAAWRQLAQDGRLVARWHPTRAECVVATAGAVVDQDTNATVVVHDAKQRPNASMLALAGAVAVRPLNTATVSLPGGDGAASVEVLLATFSGRVHGRRLRAVLADAATEGGCADAVSDATSRQLAGAYAVVHRGKCPMVQKARLLQSVGAAGLVIINTPTAGTAEAYHAMVDAPGDQAAAHAALAAVQADDVGPVVAVGDDDLRTRPVHIPVGMASALAAMRLGWVNASVVTSGSSAHPGDQGELRVLGMLAMTAAPEKDGEAGWTAVRQLLQTAEDAFLPSTHARVVARALTQHHPRSAHGEAERWFWVRAFLQQRMPEALALLETADPHRWISAAQQDGLDAGGGVHPVHSRTLVSVPLLAAMPTSRLLLADDHPTTACGLGERVPAFRVEVPLDAAALNFDVEWRLATLLQEQACLQKVAVLHAAALGAHLALLRRETAPEDWGSVVTRLLRGYGFSAPAAADELATAYIALAQGFQRHVVAPHDATMDDGASLPSPPAPMQEVQMRPPAEAGIDAAATAEVSSHDATGPAEQAAVESRRWSVARWAAEM